MSGEPERNGQGPLARALRVSARTAGIDAAITLEPIAPWNSATFTGVRLSAEVRRVAGPALGTWLDTLEEADLPVCGHLVADLTVTARAMDGATLEVLLIAAG